MWQLREPVQTQQGSYDPFRTTSREYGNWFARARTFHGGSLGTDSTRRLGNLPSAHLAAPSVARDINTMGAEAQKAALTANKYTEFIRRLPPRTGSGQRASPASALMDLAARRTEGPLTSSQPPVTSQPGHAPLVAAQNRYSYLSGGDQDSREALPRLGGHHGSGEGVALPPLAQSQPEPTRVVDTLPKPTPPPRPTAQPSASQPALSNSTVPMTTPTLVAGAPPPGLPPPAPPTRAHSFHTFPRSRDVTVPRASDPRPMYWLYGSRGRPQGRPALSQATNYAIELTADATAARDVTPRPRAQAQWAWDGPAGASSTRAVTSAEPRDDTASGIAGEDKVPLVVMETGSTARSILKRGGTQERLPQLEDSGSGYGSGYGGVSRPSTDKRVTFDDNDNQVMTYDIE